MALLDSYISAADYRAYTTNSTVTAEDIEIGVQGVACSRVVDKLCGLTDGAFNTTEAGVTRTFSGSGDELLFLERRNGRLNALRLVATDGIEVDYQGDGSFSMAFDLSEDWVAPYDPDADEEGRPATCLELLRRTGALLTVWPLGSQNIRVTGTWGHESVPANVKQATAIILRDHRDRLSASAAGAYQLLDSGIVVTDKTWAQVQTLLGPYRHKTLAVA